MFKQLNNLTTVPCHWACHNAYVSSEVVIRCVVNHRSVCIDIWPAVST